MDNNFGVCREQQKHQYFDTIMTPVDLLCLRPADEKESNNIDVTFKLFRSVVGPPGATDWSRPWHGNLA